MIRLSRPEFGIFKNIIRREEKIYNANNHIWRNQNKKIMRENTLSKEVTDYLGLVMSTGGHKMAKY